MKTNRASCDAYQYDAGQVDTWPIVNPAHYNAPPPKRPQPPSLRAFGLLRQLLTEKQWAQYRVHKAFDEPSRLYSDLVYRLSIYYGNVNVTPRYHGLRLGHLCISAAPTLSSHIPLGDHFTTHILWIRGDEIRYLEIANLLGGLANAYTIQSAIADVIWYEQNDPARLTTMRSWHRISHDNWD